MAPDSQSRPEATVGFVVDSTLPYPTALSTCRKAIFSGSRGSNFPGTNQRPRERSGHAELPAAALQ